MNSVRPRARLHQGLGKSLRYAQATSGPVATAGAHFAFSLLLLHALAPDSFGRISFLLVASQLSGGLWSALFCAPLPVLLAQAGDEGGIERAAVRRCMLATNLAAAITSLLLFWCVAFFVGLSLGGALLFAAYAACFLLRWFARSDAYAAGQPLKAVTSDLAYSAVLLLALAVMWKLVTPSLTAASAALLASAVAGLMPFGREYLSAQFACVAVGDIRPYAKVWRVHSRWSLVGVLTTEATANSHAYLLALVSGPAAFAPIAASALLIRPIGVVINALTEFERPRVAAQIGQGDMVGAFGSIRFFRSVLTLAWSVSAVAAAILLALNPRLVFPAAYDLEFLINGTALWMAVAFVRQWRAPESVLLQAGGEFRILAQASMVSSIVSVVSVAGFLWLAGPLWSISGILIGETLCAVWTLRQARQYRQRVQTAQRVPLSSNRLAKPVSLSKNDASDKQNRN
jgi:hypothetical protein